MTDIILGLYLLILVGSFVLERWLDNLNMKHSVPQLPDELQGIYDEKEYARSQEYKRENTRFSFLSSSFSLILMLVVILTGFFGILDNYLDIRLESYFILVLLFFGILGFASDFLSLPFDLWDTFKIEEKYGFNKTTPKLFAQDKLKGWLLMALIGGGLLFLITWIYTKTGTYFWLLVWGVITAFSMLMNLFYSNLIVPLFNKQVPLEDGELRDAIDQFAKKVGYKLTNIYVIDGSKRSTKANAYFTGFGPKKRVVLYDTLINDLEINEIVAVLAHEIGHYKHKHTLKGLISGIVQTGVMLFLFSLFIELPEFAQALGAKEASFHIGLIAFGIIYSPLSMIIGLVSSAISRKNEYQADAYASKHFNGEDLINALKKLSKNNLSNLTPHPSYVFFHYSHPPLLQRIRAMKDAPK